MGETILAITDYDNFWSDLLIRLGEPMSEILYPGFFSQVFHRNIAQEEQIRELRHKVDELEGAVNILIEQCTGSHK